MDDIFSWVATVATVTGAFLTASNLGARVTGRGFAVLAFGSLNWLGLGLVTDQPALVWTNAAMSCLNAFGVWRWLGRQAKVEKGGRAAAEASEATPGEALFPVSLLGRARVLCGGTEVGSCVDAMAGCRSGRIAYVVVSEGGVAGVGERLRRLEWHDARVEEGRLVSRLDAARFCSLPEISKDEWPGR